MIFFGEAFSVKCISGAVLSGLAKDLPEMGLIQGPSMDSGSLCSELPAVAGRSARFCVDMRFFPMIVQSVSHISLAPNSINRCQMHFLQLCGKDVEWQFITFTHSGPIRPTLPVQKIDREGRILYSFP